MSNNIWELAEAYLGGTLGAADNTMLRNRLATDPTFAAEFNETLDLLKALQGSGKQKRFRNMLADVHQHHQAEAHKSPFKFKLPANFWRTSAIAAGVALLTSFITYSIIGGSDRRSQSVYNTISHKIENINNDQKRLKLVQDSLMKSINKKATPVPTSDVRYTATGFALTNDGYFVTAYHVINDGNGDPDSVYIQSNDGVYYKASLVNFSGKADIAILKVDKKNFRFAKTDLPYAFADEKSDLGERIFTLGYPDNDVVYSEGYISSRNGYGGNAAQYTLELPVGHGQSGSPVWDASGNLIGILTAIGNANESKTYAVSSQELLELLHTIPNESSLRIPRSSRIKRISREQQIAQLENYTFSVKVYKK